MAAVVMLQPLLCAQDITDSIPEKEVKNIMQVLAGDSLKGRGYGTPELLKAAAFIGDRFKKAGLRPLNDTVGFFLPFRPFVDSQHIAFPDLLWNGIYSDSMLAGGRGGVYLSTGYNIVGVLPGKSRRAEVIVFSAHYDHVGIIPDRKDSIMNGANDNASGTAALLLLMEYFARRNDNERTLFFCAFSGEEIGLKGSQDFISHVNPDKIVAGINLEMLGVSEYGKKRVFILGEEYSNLPNILAKSFRKNGLRLRSEPDLNKKLFMRSDNFPFARKGIPAHTIMASDDDDNCYHQPCDELKRIDIPNLAFIIRAVAVASRPLINGDVTPSRINMRVMEQEKVFDGP